MQQQGQVSKFFLNGEWQGQGKLIDTDKDITYGETITITHIKGPVHMYTQKTKKLPENTPLHSETGYFRVFPQEGKNEGKVELCLAQPFGVCEIETGVFNENSLTVQCNKDQIVRTETAKTPFVTEVKREMWINSKGNLEYKMFLGTEKYQARHHLSAELKKVENK